jgi:hypothetical protein
MLGAQHHAYPWRRSTVYAQGLVGAGFVTSSAALPGRGRSRRITRAHNPTSTVHAHLNGAPRFGSSCPLLSCSGIRSHLR